MATKSTQSTEGTEKTEAVDTTVNTEVNTDATSEGTTEGKSILTGSDTGSETGESELTKAGSEEADTAADKTAEEVAYEFEFAEGFSAPDEEGMKELQDTFKEAGVPKDKAQKLIDYWGKLEEKRAEVQKAEAEATIKTMVEATRNDKEIGGTKYKESLSFAAKGRDKFSNPELNKVFDVTHLGSHPEIVRLFVNIGKAISEDKFLTGGDIGEGVKRNETGEPMLKFDE